MKDKNVNKKEIVSMKKINHWKNKQKKTLLTSIQKKTSPKYIPFSFIFTLAEKGLTNQEIAKILECSKEAIYSRLKREGYVRHSMRAYQKDKANFLEFRQRQILDSVSKQDMAKAGLRDKVVSVGILEDKIRLNRGETTSNAGIALLDLTRFIKQDKGE